MDSTRRENLIFDPIHGYTPLTAARGLPAGEVGESEILDHPWLQRLRQIHQLQTAWWVYPAAEHTRFQHVVGVMHLASRAVAALYDSLREACGGEAPSRGYVETLLRMAGLLHDVGHGPFGHFFDEHYLRHYGLTHETLGAKIITSELGDLLRRLRRNPNSELAENERLDPAQVAWLITRPGGEGESEQPRWLHFLRSLLSGIYTIDNMDFVLRDAYMSGFSQRSFDLERLLHYSFFSERGLTIHDRGIDALLRFMTARADLFQSIYFHRTVRAMDLTLKDLFAESREFLFPGNPLQHLRAYQGFTEFSLLVDVGRWEEEGDNQVQRELGRRWRQLIGRDIPWKMICQRNLPFDEGDAEQSSIFSDESLVEHKLRAALPGDLQEIPLRIDIARHIHRPHTRGPAQKQNFLYDSARGRVKELTDHQIFRRLPVAFRICRIYAQTRDHSAALAAALDQLLGGPAEDDLTNM